MIYSSLASHPADFRGLKYLVVGSGFYGAVMAERLAQDRGSRVVVIEKRNHIGGNSYSENDPETGIECHSYGSHIFHTGDERVWNYMNRFCTFNRYRHKVLTRHAGRTHTMPINLDTINAFYGANMAPDEARAFLAAAIAKENITAPSNFEEQAVSLVGRPLYEALIRGYSAKQWGCPPKDLPADIATRLPVRFDSDPDYFSDPWQGIPLNGYGKFFQDLLSHRNIDVYLNTDFFAIKGLLPKTCRVIYTGPIDRYFGYSGGELRWRSLLFEKETLATGDFQGTTVMNYAEETVPFTRIHEFRHFHKERAYPADKTVIAREYPRPCEAGCEPYYPVNTPGDREILARYLAAPENSGRVIFGGRLGTYRYLNMDQAVGTALDDYNSRIRAAAE